MKMAWARLIFYAAIVLLSCGSVPTQTHGARAQVRQEEDAVLEQDARLNTPISLQGTGISLEELLQAMSRSNLKLNADRACAEQKLQIRVQHRSRLAVMESLARLLPGSWVPRTDHSGYRLQLAVRAVEKREAWWKLFLSERDKALSAQRARVLQTLQGDWKAWNSGDSDEATRKQEDEARGHHALFQ